MTQKVSDDQTLQTNQRHREKEPQNNNNHKQLK